MRNTGADDKGPFQNSFRSIKIIKKSSCFVHYKSSRARVTHTKQESENKCSFVGQLLLVYLGENPQHGVE